MRSFGFVAVAVFLCAPSFFGRASPPAHSQTSAQQKMGEAEIQAVETGLLPPVTVAGEKVSVFYAGNALPNALIKVREIGWVAFRLGSF